MDEFFFCLVMATAPQDREKLLEEASEHSQLKGTFLVYSGTSKRKKLMKQGVSSPVCKLGCS